ncbi:MAG: ferredoxin reductase family protein [Bacteroidia bacterium]
MRVLKQEIYFPILIGVHFIFWAVDLYLYQGSFIEVSSDTMFFGELTNESWKNVHRILGEVFSSWVVTVFAANFLMATRAKWVEKLFGGLDKMYLIHRRSGVIAVILLLAHFLIVPRDLTEFTPGKPLGFYAFILIIIGVIISAAPPLKKKIPYHKWINIHKLMGLFYVLGVVHGIMVNSLIKELPITRVYVFGMAAIGIASWIYRAFLYRIFNKSYKYSVSNIKDMGHGITEVSMKPQNEIIPFTEGQFAFFNFSTLSKREQHPFTISSHPTEVVLRITVKNLGDYTSKMSSLHEGDTVLIEGPFGLFSTSEHQDKEQIWIAGGIGITPFLSLAKGNIKKKVKLFWCVNSEDEAIYKDELMAIQNPNIEITIWPSKDLGYFNFEKMNLDFYEDKAFLICGPQALKESLFAGLKNKNVHQNNILDEEFAFR